MIKHYREHLDPDPPQEPGQGPVEPDPDDG